MGPATKVALGLLRLYKLVLSPAFYLFGARCRHLPSCSDYAAEAYRLHGFWPGCWLTLARLLRCHPWGSHGFDPVPDHIRGHPLLPWRYGCWRLPDPDERQAHSASTTDTHQNSAKGMRDL